MACFPATRHSASNGRELAGKLLARVGWLGRADLDHVQPTVVRLLACSLQMRTDGGCFLGGPAPARRQGRGPEPEPEPEPERDAAAALVRGSRIQLPHDEHCGRCRGRAIRAAAADLASERMVATFYRAPAAGSAGSSQVPDAGVESNERLVLVLLPAAGADASRLLLCSYADRLHQYAPPVAEDVATRCLAAVTSGINCGRPATRSQCF
jgi:hypothetical protein